MQHIYLLYILKNKNWNAYYEQRQMNLHTCLQTLCAKGAQTLQSKSVNVEDAANELINMLCDIPDDEDDSMMEDIQQFLYCLLYSSELQ